MNPLLIVHLAVIIVGTLLLSSVFLVVRSASHSDEKAEEIKTPTWENAEPFKADEKISIMDEVVADTLKVKKED
jgi:hypothetical protein